MATLFKLTQQLGPLLPQQIGGINMRTATSRILTTMTAVLLNVAIPMAKADFTAFQNLPTNNSFQESHHQAGGPVLADDFVPTNGASGPVSSVAWWGSAATSDQWEITFHPNDPATNKPAVVNLPHGGFSVIETAVGVADVPGHPDIFHYSTSVPLGLFSVNSGNDYWFSVANINAGWTWADALNGPTVGTEHFNAQRSTGNLAPDGGPHAGPWVDVHTDFAAQINTVPEPSTLVMASTAILTGLAVGWRRRHMAAA